MEKIAPTMNMPSKGTMSQTNAKIIAIDMQERDAEFKTEPTELTTKEILQIGTLCILTSFSGNGGIILFAYFGMSNLGSWIGLIVALIIAYILWNKALSIARKMPWSNSPISDTQTEVGRHFWGTINKNYGLLGKNEALMILEELDKLKYFYDPGRRFSETYFAKGLHIPPGVLYSIAISITIWIGAIRGTDVPLISASFFALLGVVGAPLALEGWRQKRSPEYKELSYLSYNLDYCIIEGYFKSKRYCSDRKETE